MRLCLALAAAVALLLAAVFGMRAAGWPPAPGGLHSVWCVQRGYPADLAMPEVVGPGTGLSGCPAGEVQVSPQG